MSDPLEEVSKALGISGNTEKLKVETWSPWNYKDSIETKSLPTIIKNNSEEDDIEKDYRTQRDTFNTLVEKGSTAIDGILELAKEGEHPRGYEVAGNLIKQVAEVAEKLGDLQEKMKRLKEVPNNAPKNVTNALFVGSTAELQKLIKGKNNE